MDNIFYDKEEKMVFKKKKEDSKPKKSTSKEEDLIDILERKGKKNNKLDNLSDELIIKAIKDMLSKE